MLHIVQVVFAGRPETPRVFLDQAQAESAFVELVKKCWKQSYPAYCADKGVSVDGSSSAKDFLETLDMAEKSQVNYWIVNPDDAGPGQMKHLEWMSQGRENLETLIKKVERMSGLLNEGLTGLLDDLAELTGCFANMASPGPGAQAAGPESIAATSPPVPAREEPEGVPEEYTDQEWKTFVGSVMNVCGGGRNESALFTRHDWRQDVYSNATSLEYWDWVAAKVHKCREKAEKAGYAVVKDPDSPGNFRIQAPGGTMEETSFYSELDAWCHIGMNLPG